MKRKPLFLQLSITMTVLVTFVIVACGIINYTQLERYYVREKVETLKDAYDVIDKAEMQGNLASDAFDVTFEKLCARDNLNILVLGKGEGVLRSNSSTDFATMQMNELYYEQQEDNERVLLRSDLYRIERRNDLRMQSEYLMLWGTLEDGSPILIRTALESIRESTKISLRFFFLIAFVALLISIVIILIVSRKVANPIHHLTELSLRMSNLDFDARYESSSFSSREIDTLGNSMNEMSENLEVAISDLKSVNNELQKDIQRKEQIDEMRKEFLSNVSHELKTPLALISGYAEGLKENINDDEESRNFYCDVIMDEAEKMNRMVKQLLNLNEIEFGRDMVEMGRFNMTELVRGILSANAILAEQAGAKIVFDETLDPACVWADEFLAEQVLTNFLTNAIHHCEGEKIVRISYLLHDELLRVSVFNTGKQIPEDAIDRIWEKFYKVDKARTREYGGSGIGLSIVKAIMDSHNQKCGIINHEDGVEFWAEFDCMLGKNDCTPKK
ncbi:sensor histidine kinase [Agathobacter ruminis]|uniref:histidine kinase n=1 Tax=Agathobacter ruminis TaxID=1712665 RepID=A0A2G3E0W6_9FIRM|nr:HAMP domain-containing sensor histidine kinase [Agathobacter ruminis]MDC7301378.1 HAMP domain-containing histidine kinase [Agathobacter ruminis]PHU36908.1 two-component sensor histidine kinase [Agathobacter ruminis]